ncbi:redoxin family protein [Desulfovibrio sp. OttesenSCG-928-C14]|nr:redoxin family protein [Desulfovibrio sp. OttesenSCG-928-O18]MDL2313810.1 redoxin family protein [Desulfovibrio sp. OttesenSCG-928-C14]
MEIITIGFIASVFGAGLLSFFSPCVLPLLPVYFGYLSGGPMPVDRSGKTSFSKALAFTSGLSASFFLLGFSAGALGHFINSHAFFLACGTIIVLFGVHQTGLISLPLLNRDKRLSVRFDPQKGLGGAFLLGFLFSFGWTPCVGPVLGAVLGISSQQGSALAGGWLLLVYSLGLSLPFWILAMGSNHLLGRVRSIYPHFGKIRVAGGVLIMLMGFWMLHNQISIMRVESDMPPLEVSRSSINSPILERSLPGLDREGVSLAQLRGKTVYIKFWTTWCPLCLAGLEDFAVLAEQAASSPDITVISIVTPGLNGEVSKEDFIAWARAQRLSFPVYFDESGTVTREFGIRAYPTAVYLTANGDVLKKVVGDESNAQILGELNSLKDK